MESTVEPFEYDGGVVDPGESEKLRFAISETYLGDPVRIPVTIVNGAEPGPTCFLSAAIHGDELNGIEVVREVVDEWDHDDIHGCVVGLPVLNVPGFITQERYLPIYERDLNRAFPGKEASPSAYQIAHRIYTNFIAPCDFRIDFHTSTRGRTNMFHVRADMENEAVARLAHAFGSHVIIASEGSEGTLRREATEDGVPTITIEMVYFPTGSLDLNPTEEYWRRLKQALGNHYFDILDKIRSAIWSALDTISPPGIYQSLYP
jgi:hypothetical protein